MNPTVYYLKEYTNNSDLNTISQDIIDGFQIGDYVVHNINNMTFTMVKEFFDNHRIELRYCTSGGQDYRKYGPGTCRIVDITEEPKLGIRDDITTGFNVELNVNGSSGNVELEKQFALELQNRFELFKKKQKSYGSSNISTFGLKGLLVRMWDKIERLKNLIWNEIEDPIEDEKLIDTLGDLGLYAFMAILVKKDLWPKE